MNMCRTFQLKEKLGLKGCRVWYKEVVGFIFDFVLFCFSRQGFSVALNLVLELALLDTAGAEIRLPLPPESWD